MGNKDLSRKPYQLWCQNEEVREAWYYECPQGIDVYIQTTFQVAPFNVCIPWSKIRAALRRKDK